MTNSDPITPARGMTAAVAAYIASTAARIRIPGAEPTFLPGDGRAVLLLHGWGASAESLRFLAQGLHATGRSVLSPTLPGHGTDPVDMAQTGPHDWIGAARSAFATLLRDFDEVAILGVSMGGALALQLGCIEAGRIAAIAVVNAPVFLDRPAFAAELLSGPADGMMEAWAGQPFFGPAVSEITYPARSRKSGVDLLAMTALAREALPRIRAPLLVLQSAQDPVVPPANADAIMARAGSAIKEAASLDRSFHIAQLDLDRDEIVRLAADFFDRHRPTSTAAT